MNSANQNLVMTQLMMHPSRRLKTLNAIIVEGCVFGLVTQTDNREEAYALGWR
jgi:hypothetical protein